MTTQPPKEFSKFRFHWLDAERTSEPSIAEWLGGVWYCTNEDGSISSFEMYRRGWRYLGPVRAKLQEIEGSEFLHVKEDFFRKLK